MDQQITCVMFQQENGANDPKYIVGYNGVTRIEEFQLSGLNCDIPHIRVWQGEEKVAEFCRHNIVGIWFKHSNPPTDTNDHMPF